MKKYLIILLAGIISFFGIDEVNAWEGEKYKSDTCILQEQTGNTCNYHCKVTDNSNNFFEFDYNVSNVVGITTEARNIVTGGSDCRVFPNMIMYDYNGNIISDNACIINTTGENIGGSYNQVLTYKGIYEFSDAIASQFYKDGNFRCPNVYADVSTEIFRQYQGHTANYTDTKTFTINVLRDETQVEEDAKDFLENEITDQCAIFGENLTPYIKSGIKIIRILVAVIFAIMTVIDFLKVVLTGEDKSYKEATGKFVKRLIIVIIIEILPILISLLIDISGILQDYNIKGDIYCSLF